MTEEQRMVLNEIYEQLDKEYGYYFMNDTRLYADYKVYESIVLLLAIKWYLNK